MANFSDKTGETSRKKTLKQSILRPFCLLLASALLLAGCSSQPEENIPQDLLFFTQDMEGKDRDDIREAFREMVRTTFDALSETGQPYLISRLTKLTGQEPIMSEQGALERFQAVPLTDGSFRVVFPGADAMSSLFWNVSGFQEHSVTAWRADRQTAWKAFWEENDPGSYVREYSADAMDIHNLAAKMQRQWLSEMFTTGFYQTARFGHPLDYDENPTIFPANPNYFKYEVMSAADYFEDPKLSGGQTENGSEDQSVSEEEQKMKEEEIRSSAGDYVLIVSTREPQNYAQNLKRAALGYTASAGELSSHHNLVFKDYTFSKYEVTAFVSSEGVIERVIVRVNTRFIATKNKEDLSAREELMSVWTIDPYPQAASMGYPADIDAMLNGQIPPDGETLITY